MVIPKSSGLESAMAFPSRGRPFGTTGHFGLFRFVAWRTRNTAVVATAASVQSKSRIVSFLPPFLLCLLAFTVFFFFVYLFLLFSSSPFVVLVGPLINCVQFFAQKTK